jgi:hypothetical protein
MAGKLTRTPTRSVSSLSKAGDSGNDDSRDGRRDKAVEYNVSLPTTVGELHEAIEEMGPGAWRTFTRLWEIACGIPKRAK